MGVDIETIFDLVDDDDNSKSQKQKKNETELFRNAFVF